jgi:hypothetical protein
LTVALRLLVTVLQVVVVLAHLAVTQQAITLEMVVRALRHPLLEVL